MNICFLPIPWQGRVTLLHRLFFAAFLSIILHGTLSAQYDTSKIYYPAGKLKAIIPLYNNIPEGTAKYYYDNGNLSEEREFLAGRVEGTVKRYRPDGTLLEMYTIESGKREGPVSRFDEKGNFVDEQFYSGGLLQPALPPDSSDADQTTNVASENNLPSAPPEEKLPTHVALQAPAGNEKLAAAEAFVFNPKDTLTLDLVKPDQKLLAKFDQIPTPAQGMDYFNHKLNYPDYAKKKLIQGTVVLKALVDEYGDIRSVDVVKGIGGGCDESASVAVDYTKFKPAVFKGSAYPVYILYPVVFTLPAQH